MTLATRAPLKIALNPALRYDRVGKLVWGQDAGADGLYDLSKRQASLDAKRDPLVRIDAIVPWEEFRPALDRVSTAE